MTPDPIAVAEVVEIGERWIQRHRVLIDTEPLLLPETRAELHAQLDAAELKFLRDLREAVD
jgi:hypothetical protein